MTAEIEAAEVKFDNALERILSAVDDSLVVLEDAYRQKLIDIGPVVLDYLGDVEITSVLRGPVLTNQLNDAVDGAQSLITTATDEANFLINQSVENTQYDYQDGLQIAIDEFNADIGKIKNWTTEMTTELEEVSSAISDKISDSNASLSSKVEACMDRLGDISSEQSTDLSALIDRWVNDRPMIYLTGFIQLPSALYRGENNKFRIGVSNSGGKDWSGWVGMRLALEDNEGDVLGSWDYNTRPGRTPVLEAGTTEVYAVSVVPPAGTEDGDILTLYLLVNTV